MCKRRVGAQYREMCAHSDTKGIAYNTHHHLLCLYAGLLCTYRNIFHSFSLSLYRHRQELNRAGGRKNQRAPDSSKKVENFFSKREKLRWGIHFHDGTHNVPFTYDGKTKSVARERGPRTMEEMEEMCGEIFYVHNV